MNMNKLSKQLVLYNMNEVQRQYGISAWMQTKIKQGGEGLNAGSLELIKNFARMQMEAWAEVVND